MDEWYRVPVTGKRGIRNHVRAIDDDDDDPEKSSTLAIGDSATTIDFPGVHNIIKYEMEHNRKRIYPREFSTPLNSKRWTIYEN